MSDVTGGSSDMRSSVQQPSTVFDISVEADALKILRAIHMSVLSPDEKNTLRNIVFAVRAGTQQLTEETMTMFTHAGVTVQSTEDVQKMTTPSELAKEPVSIKHRTQRGSRIGSARMRPVFTVSHVPDTIVPPATDVLNTAVSETAIQETVPQSEASVSQPVSTNETNEEKARIAPTSTPTSAPTSVTPDDNVPEIPADPVPASGVATVITSESPATIDPAERIKEIKHQVNTLVGNPVNLIDVSNEVGREYMNALLDAMKKSSGGEAGALTEAMQRLEASFLSVQKMMHGKNAMQTHDVAPAPEVAVSMTASHGAPEQKVATVPPVLDTASVPTQVPVTEQAPPAEPILETPIAEAFTTESHPVESVGVETPLVATAQQFPSVAKEKQVQDMMIEKKQAAATTDQQREDAKIAAMDPLMTPEVTKGLQQLLSEWSLFKNSGLFGTGPSGVEHPLYKKLSVLTMAAVAAGRYEGVTPQIRRSIADYMNGWRYEEGIVHQQGETFEQYLRRVVSHILDKRALDLPLN